MEPNVDNKLSTTEVCRRIANALQNMGRGLRCSICMSSLKDPVVLSTCMHAYCRKCLIDAFKLYQQAQQPPRCPECSVTCHPRRSMVNAPLLAQVAHAHQRTLRHFGLTPVEYEPNLNMTQLPTDDVVAAASDNRLVSVHQHYQASKTFCQALAEPEQQQVCVANEQALLKVALEARKSAQKTTRDVDEQDSEPNEPDSDDEDRKPAARTTDSDDEQEARGEQAAQTTTTENMDDNGVQAGSEPNQPVPDDEQVACKPAARATTTMATENVDSDSNEEQVVGKPAARTTSTATDNMDADSDEEQVARAKPVARTTTTLTTDNMDTDSDEEQHVAPAKPVARTTTTTDNMDVDSDEEQVTRSKPAARTTTTTTNNMDANSDEERVARAKPPARTTTTMTITEDRSGVAIERTSSPTSVQGRDSSTSKEPTDRDGSQESIEPDAMEATSPSPSSIMEANHQGDGSQESADPVSDAVDATASTNDQLAQPEEPTEMTSNRSEEAAMSVDNNPTTSTTSGGDESPRLQETNELQDATSSTGANGGAATVASSSVAAAVSSRNGRATRSRAARSSSRDVAVTTDNSNNKIFEVGSVVHVQARTWPGINKHGGVGRVTRVETGANGRRYDVVYVLGGKETNVDAVFVSQPDEELGSVNESKERKSYRLATSPEIPPQLLQKLAAEGFDVDGSATRNNKTDPKTTAGKENSKNEKKRKAVRYTASSQKPRKKPKLVKRMLAGIAKSRSSQPAPPAVPTSWTAAQKCSLADQLYNRRIDQAMKKSVIVVASSSLNQVDSDELRVLIKETKRSKVSIKMTESIAKKTTLCVMATYSQSNADNTIALVRTMKGMQAALAGVPIVSPAWIRSCIVAKRVIMPKASMYIRTLPAKVEGSSDHGVAFTAAAMEHTQGKFRPLQHCHVFLCGLSSRKAKDALLVLRQAGATILSHPSSVVAKFKTLEMDEEDRVVIVCDDSATITGALARELPNYHQQTLVVNLAWVFDSVSSGKMLSSDGYCPSNATAKDFWELITSTT